MSRTVKILQELTALFQRKNDSYSSGKGEFANFTDNALVQSGQLNKYSYAFTLVTKHLDALKYRLFESDRFRAAWREEVAERARDCAVYFAIIAAMVEDDRESIKFPTPFPGMVVYTSATVAPQQGVSVASASEIERPGSIVFPSNITYTNFPGNKPV